jgi:hypothetical protein
VPDELKRGIKKLKHINWSSLARRAFEEAIYREQMRFFTESVLMLCLSVRCISFLSTLGQHRHI